MSEVATKVRESMEALLENPLFLGDTKWQKRVFKAIEPLDIEDRVKSQLYTSAKKELDSEAMELHRRKSEFKPVTDEDIQKRFDEKWAEYLSKKAASEAKKKAVSSTS